MTGNVFDLDMGTKIYQAFPLVQVLGPVRT